MARKRLGAATAGSLVATGSTATIAPGANHNVVKSDGAAFSSQPLYVTDVLNEAYLDYTPRTSIGTTTDDFGVHALTDAKGVAASGLGITSVNDVQTVTMSATGGTWIVTYKGQSTAGQANNVALATLQTAIQGLSTVGSGNITVTGTAGSSYVLTASGALVATLLDDIEITNTALTGGTATISHNIYGGHRLYNTDTTSATASSIYRTIQLAASTTFMSLEFDWSASGSTITSCSTLACIAGPLPTSGGLVAGQVPDAPCHIDFFLDHFEYGIIQSGAVVVQFSYTYDTQFSPTTYQFAEVAVDKYGGSVCIRAPDQTVWSFSHALISATTARYVFHETWSAVSTTNYKPQIARFSADSAPLRIHSSGGTNRTQSLVTDGRAAARNYLPSNTLQLIAPSFTTRRAKFDLNATSSSAGQVSTLGVTARSGVINTKVATQTAQVTYNTSAAEIALVSATLFADELSFMGTGAVYRFRIAGGISWIATSGTITFKVYLGTNAAAQTFVVPSQGSAGGTYAAPVPFVLDVWAQVRTTGASGTYIAGGHGFIWPTSTTVIYLIPATANISSTAVVDTTTAMTAKIASTFATSNANNGIKVEVGSIERPM